MIEMNEDQIRKIIRNACIAFRDTDGEAFSKFKFGERAFTHRLAHHLENGFQKYKELRIDCEYNRKVNAEKRAPGAAKKIVREMLYSAKQIIQCDADLPVNTHYPAKFRELVEEKLKKSQEDVEDYELDQFIEEFEKWGKLAGHLVYPDIIVHERGIQDNNILVIEAKIDESNEALIKHDYLKLRCFTAKGELHGQVGDENTPTDGFNYQYGLFLNVNYDGNYITADLLTSGGKDPVSLLDDVNFSSSPLVT